MPMPHNCAKQPWRCYHGKPERGVCGCKIGAASGRAYHAPPTDQNALEQILEELIHVLSKEKAPPQDFY